MIPRPTAQTKEAANSAQAASVIREGPAVSKRKAM
jgi:hypothetical protein